MWRRRSDEDLGGVRLERDGLALGAARVPLRSAGLPYWELAPAHWGPALDVLVGVRIPIVRVDVPWSVHERAPGVLEWGARRPELALGSFLEAVHARGLLAAIRPGPWLGDAAPDGGIPRRVLELADVAALRSDGSAQGAPSPASGAFWTEANAWLVEVSERVAPLVHPRGPVVLWLSAGLGPLPAPWGGGALDHSAGALAFFARFLAERRRALPARPVVDGPRAAEDLERALLWVEAGEAAQLAAHERVLAVRPLRGSARELADEPIPALVQLADHPLGAGPARASLASGAAHDALSIPAEAALDFAALRLLGMRADENALGALAGAPSAERLFAAADELEPPAGAAVLAMSGARALDLATLVPHGPAGALGALLGADGRARESVASRWRALFRVLDAIGFPGLERRHDCLLLASRDAARLREACSAAGWLSATGAEPRALEAVRVAPRPTGFAADQPELDADVAFAALFDGLRRAGIKFAVADDGVPAERLARERAVVALGFERMRRAAAQRLFSFAESGGTLVLGPRLPVCDFDGAPLGLRLPFERKEPVAGARVGGLALEAVAPVLGGTPVLEADGAVLAAVAPYGRGRLVHFGFRLPWRALERDAAALAGIAAALLAPSGVGPAYAASDPVVETELWAGGERRFLFLVNPSRAARTVRVALAHDEALREVRGSGEHARAGDPLRVAPGEVIVREVVRL
jgi:beta-galactosidase